MRVRKSGGYRACHGSVSRDRVTVRDAYALASGHLPTKARGGGQPGQAHYDGHGRQEPAHP